MSTHQQQQISSAASAAEGIELLRKQPDLTPVLDSGTPKPAEPEQPWQFDIQKHLQRAKRRQARAITRLSQRRGPPRPKYNGPRVYVGFDSEWLTRPGPNGELTNDILCISAVMACADRRTRYVYYLEGRQRPSVQHLQTQLLRKALAERTITSVPDKITWFGHFLRGDLSALGDFWVRRSEFRGLGRTLTSGPGGHEVFVDELDGDGGEPPPVGQDVVVKLRDGKRQSVRIYFIDTIRLTPGQRGLAYAAQMIGRQKLDLHADLGVPNGPATERLECVGLGLEASYGKGRMDLVLRDYPEAFEQYALEDAEIALEYGLFMERFARDELGLDTLRRTLSGLASAVVRQQLGGTDAVAALIGREKRTRQVFDESRRTFRTIETHELSPALRLFFEFARESYHGGRNEAFVHGPTEDGPYYDYDIKGAYTTALANIRPLDYVNAKQVFDPHAYGIDDMGVAWITFTFPEGTRFPCLPVRTADNLLVYPLEGRREDRVFATAPELHLALRMGAKVEIIQGIIIPWGTGPNPFEEFVRLVHNKRQAYPKVTHLALHEVWKELGNSVYGLTAQGLRDKRTFDPATLKTKPIEPSAFTEPFIAAWVTGQIRAVLGEILAGIPEDGVVVSATTDGLLTNVSYERLRLDGPLCTYFGAIRQRVTENSDVLDPTPKHAAMQVISVAMRMTFTARRHEDYEPICARGGIKVDAAPRFHNTRLVKLYFQQFPGMTVEHEELISAREQLTKESDLVGIKKTRRLNMRSDFKRRPTNPREVALTRRSGRIGWDTRPWRTAGEAEEARARVDSWSRTRSRVFKSMADYRDWEAFYEASTAMAEACRHAGRAALPIKADNAAGVLKRAFLQAGRIGEWGVQFPPRSMATVAAALTEAGYVTSKEDVTYAGRRKTPLLRNSVAWVPETQELLRVILRLFPEFDWRAAFRRSDQPAMERAFAAVDDG